MNATKTHAVMAERVQIAKEVIVVHAQLVSREKTAKAVRNQFDLWVLLSVVLFSLILKSHFFHSDINECLTKPCQNRGVCVNNFGSYSCSCVSGFLGQNCETGTPNLWNYLDQCISLTPNLIFRYRRVPEKAMPEWWKVQQRKRRLYVFVCVRFRRKELRKRYCF